MVIVIFCFCVLILFFGFGFFWVFCLCVFIGVLIYSFVGGSWVLISFVLFGAYLLYFLLDFGLLCVFMRSCVFW